ncbi:MAG: 4-alpha-glucanotransferase [Faecalibacterium sp.]|jgi:4-alpha-glucanotransferase|nr:4-alpha-glucanotransferase [Faecalibacterium sp.]
MRASGILMPIFSLPGDYGIGTLGQEAYRFVDFLAEAGQTYWQMLPIGPTGYGDSPYQSFSAFAGNPYFIDPAFLVRDGWLSAAELPKAKRIGHIQYAALYHQRPKLLAKAAARLNQTDSADYKAFCKHAAYWLEDYALFMAIKEENGQVGLSSWPEALRLREPAAMAAARKRLASRCDYFKAVQYLVSYQWDALKAYANEKGVKIIGDIPIYVSPDSSDLWAHPELFQTDRHNNPDRVAGCPPDAFSDDGQLWGNPLYDWPVHEKDGFAWWCRRMKHATHIYDVVRIDHFRGFESYYSIPAGSENARKGKWCKGPDHKFIEALHKALPDAGIIAEDLGFMTPDVQLLLADSGYPGMKVLQFAFDSRESSNYLPHTYPRRCVVYTGTHDNTTTRDWQKNASAEDVAYACEYLGCTRRGLTKAMIRAALSSVADTAVIPMADWLELGAEARINTPSTTAYNWQWRMQAGCLTSELAARIHRQAQLYGRLAPAQKPAAEAKAAK